MRTEQINDIKAGTKLIFFRFGGVLFARTCNVFTFAKWHISETFYYTNELRFWQCQELLDMGNNVHNFDIYDCEIFDPEIHSEHVIMNKQLLLKQESAFIEKYGA